MKPGFPQVSLLSAERRARSPVWPCVLSGKRDGRRSDATDLGRVDAYERRTKNRKTVLDRIRSLR